MGMEQIGFEDGEVRDAANRLPGPPMIWTRLQLTPRPDRERRRQWKQRWNPFAQCSWPPEDELIENFRQAVFDRAKLVMGADLAKTEKFTTSIKDGIDIRDTVRHWYDGEIYVKVLPPARGKLDCAVMLFDSPADPREYPWRTTWFAEHKDDPPSLFMRPISQPSLWARESVWQPMAGRCFCIHPSRSRISGATLDWISPPHWKNDCSLPLASTATARTSLSSAPVHLDELGNSWPKDLTRNGSIYPFRVSVTQRFNNCVRSMYLTGVRSAVMLQSSFAGPRARSRVTSRMGQLIPNPWKVNFPLPG